MQEGIALTWTKSGFRSIRTLVLLTVNLSLGLHKSTLRQERTILRFRFDPDRLIAKIVHPACPACECVVNDLRGSGAFMWPSVPITERPVAFVQFKTAHLAHHRP